MSGCPSRTVIELLANKWTLLAICALKPGPLRFGEIRRRLEGVTQKMLTQTLRNMERDGLLTRTVYATAPPSVEYELTPLGSKVTRLMGLMRDWAEGHVGQVVAARSAYDKSQAPAPRTGMRHGAVIRA